MLHEYEEEVYVRPLQELRQELVEEVERENITEKRWKYVPRDRRDTHNRLFKDYFADDSTFTEDQFRRRFRMHKHVFMCIVNYLLNEYGYFTLRYNAAKNVGLSPLQKCTTPMRMLAHGISADAYDEYVKIGATMAIECLKRFCNGVIHLYEGTYLRKPNVEDFERVLRVVEDRGFPGMIGSIDCMYWEWKNCPVGWQGQFSGGHQGMSIVILEVVVSFDLWICHAFFGLTSTLNEINVLDRSTEFDDVEQVRAPNVNFIMNGRQYDLTYYLADGIYPKWSTFIQSIHAPQGEREKLFVERQEAYKKDLERAFGVLQSRFQIIRQPARLWNLEDLSMIMRACIILHNMIVEDERSNYAYNQGLDDYDQLNTNGSSSSFQYTTIVLPQFVAHVRTRAELHDKEGHRQLKNDLIQHVWQNLDLIRCTDCNK